MVLDTFLVPTWILLWYHVYRDNGIWQHRKQRTDTCHFNFISGHPAPVKVGNFMKISYGRQNRIRRRISFLS